MVNTKVFILWSDWKLASTKQWKVGNVEHNYILDKLNTEADSLAEERYCYHESCQDANWARRWRMSTYRGDLRGLQWQGAGIEEGRHVEGEQHPHHWGHVPVVRADAGRRVSQCVMSVGRWGRAGRSWGSTWGKSRRTAPALSAPSSTTSSTSTTGRSLVDCLTFPHILDKTFSQFGGILSL